MPGQDVVVVDPSDLDAWPEAGVEHGITAASGTPTFWRQTLMSHGERLARVPLRQVTLGGEPVDQGVLDQLAGVFPEARITWIYASSEVGASIVVHDGRAGFPVEWLGRDVPGRPGLAVDDGELVISSPHHGDGLEGAVHTGDAVVVHDGRVLITGRIERRRDQRRRREGVRGRRTVGAAGPPRRGAGRTCAAAGPRSWATWWSPRSCSPPARRRRRRSSA